jgi:NAD(P)-dependent dehydrogenase (short-subunit alcohol dehydrogenase family)
MDLSEPVVLPEELAGLERVDAMVHCAGIADIASVEESGPELWQRTFAINLASAADLTRRLLPALRAARGAVVSSTSRRARGRCRVGPRTSWVSSTRRLMRICPS